MSLPTLSRQEVVKPNYPLGHIDSRAPQTLHLDPKSTAASLVQELENKSTLYTSKYSLEGKLTKLKDGLKNVALWILGIFTLFIPQIIAAIQKGVTERKLQKVEVEILKAGDRIKALQDQLKNAQAALKKAEEGLKKSKTNLRKATDVSSNAKRKASSAEDIYDNQQKKRARLETKLTAAQSKLKEAQKAKDLADNRQITISRYHKGLTPTFVANNEWIKAFANFYANLRPPGNNNQSRKTIEADQQIAQGQKELLNAQAAVDKACQGTKRSYDDLAHAHGEEAQAAIDQASAEERIKRAKIDLQVAQVEEENLLQELENFFTVQPPHDANNDNADLIEHLDRLAHKLSEEIEQIKSEINSDINKKLHQAIDNLTPDVGLRNTAESEDEEEIDPKEERARIKGESAKILNLNNAVERMGKLLANLSVKKAFNVLKEGSTEVSDDDSDDDDMPVLYQGRGVPATNQHPNLNTPKAKEPATTAAATEATTAAAKAAATAATEAATAAAKAATAAAKAAALRKEAIRLRKAAEAATAVREAIEATAAAAKAAGSRPQAPQQAQVNSAANNPNLNGGTGPLVPYGPARPSQRNGHHFRKLDDLLSKVSTKKFLGPAEGILAVAQRIQNRRDKTAENSKLNWNAVQSLLSRYLPTLPLLEDSKPNSQASGTQQQEEAVQETVSENSYPNRRKEYLSDLNYDIIKKIPQINALVKLENLASDHNMELKQAAFNTLRANRDEYHTASSKVKRGVAAIASGIFNIGSSVRSGAAAAAEAAAAAAAAATEAAREAAASGISTLKREAEVLAYELARKRDEDPETAARLVGGAAQAGLRIVGAARPLADGAAAAASTYTRTQGRLLALGTGFHAAAESKVRQDEEAAAAAAEAEAAAAAAVAERERYDRSVILGAAASTFRREPTVENAQRLASAAASSATHGDLLKGK